MSTAVLAISGGVHAAVRAHLLRRNRLEQVAFAFARPDARRGEQSLIAVEWMAVPTSGFVSQSRYHVKLTDEARAAAIKRAHDLDAGLVEFHSHPTLGGACFSPSDLTGLRELVPHVRWRLKQRPYLAFVLALDGYDGLGWIASDRAPRQADLLLDGRLLPASRRTLMQGGLGDGGPGWPV